MTISILSHAMRLLFLVLLTACTHAQTPLPDAPSTAYVGGHWWDGQRFEPRDTTWAERGVFVERPRGRIVRTVDLRDRWVVPPFGDAHTHMLADSYSAETVGPQYLERGIFYALVLNNGSGPTGEVRGRDALPAGLEVAYANGGITSTGSHPAPLYEQIWGNENADRNAPRDDTTAWSGHRTVYWFFDTLADLEAEWPAYLATRPAAVKVYLTYNVQCDGRPSYRGCGLRPEVLGEVVRRAHAAGLPVVAHVNTSADVDRALEAGADALAHLPIGNDGVPLDDGRYVLEDATLEALAASGAVAVATASLLAKNLEAAPTDTLQAALARQTAELRRLRAVGVPIALGADQWMRTSAFEADYLAATGALDPADLLDAWARVTPQAIFPGREIGALEVGYEASLLALECDPTRDWSCTERIANREKQGADLEAALAEAE